MGERCRRRCTRAATVGSRVRAANCRNGRWPSGNRANKSTAPAARAGSRSWARRNSAGFSNFFVSKADWVRSGFVVTPVQFGDARTSDLPDTPTAVELAPDEPSRAALTYFAQKFKAARPLMLPPDVPAERAAALRAAFDATMRDPAYIAEARRIGLDVNPLSGAEIERVLAGIFATPEPVVARLRELIARAGK